MRDSHRFPIARAMRHLAFLVKEIEALDRKSPEASAVRTWPSPINSCTPREIRTTLAQKQPPPNQNRFRFYPEEAGQCFTLEVLSSLHGGLRDTFDSLQNA